MHVYDTLIYWDETQMKMSQTCKSWFGPQPNQLLTILQRGN